MKKTKTKTYKQLPNALKALGFNVELPKRYNPKNIYVINDSILRLEFSRLIVEKRKENCTCKDILENTFSFPTELYSVPFCQYEGQNGVHYWNGSSYRPKIYMATWDAGGYKYCVISPKGVNFKIMNKWEANFK